MENENLNNGLEPGLNGSPQKTLESKTTRNDSRSTVDNVSHPNSSFDNPALKFSNTLAVESSMDQSWGLTNAYTATASVASVPFDTQSRLLSIPQFDSSVPDRPNPDSQQLLRNDQENDNDKDSDGSEQEAVAIAVAALTTLASSNSSSMADGNPPEDILSLANILTSLSLKDSVDSMDVRDNDESVLLTLNRDGIDNASKAFQSNENEIREGPTTNILVSNDSVIIPDETKDENLALTVSCANLKSSSEAPSTGMFADNDFDIMSEKEKKGNHGQEVLEFSHDPLTGGAEESKKELLIDKAELQGTHRTSDVIQDLGLVGQLAEQAVDDEDGEDKSYRESEAN